MKMAKYEILLLFLLVWIGSSESVTTNAELTGNYPISKSSKASPTASSRVLKIDEYEPNESISSPFLQPYPSASMSFQPRWLNDGHKLETNWFGFNRFIPRSARNMHMAQNHRLRDAQLLGESTFVYPTTHFYPNPTFYFEDVVPFPHHINDLQSQSTVPYHDHFVSPRLEHPMRYQRGYMASNERPQQQQHRPFYNQNNQNFNYQRSNSNLQRSSASPTPVTIKILPLKLSSIDISNALKSMSWIPIPIDLLNRNNNNNNQNQNKDNSPPLYSDKRQSLFDEDEDESELPPPSSHVATPPVGITYAEGQRSERFVSRFSPPK